MGADLTMILTLLLSPGIMVFMHAAGARLFPRRAPQFLAFMSIAAAAVPVGWILWLLVLRHVPTEGSAAVAASYGLLCYGSLGYTYFHFFNMSETARRIRILHEIHQAGVLSERDMQALYKTTDIISIRLGRLVRLGQLSCRNGSYAVQGRTLYLAGHLIVAWRKVLGLGEAG